MSKLVPTLVIDKNGKQTTVYKLPSDKTPKRLGTLFGALPVSGPSRNDLYKAIVNETLELAGDHCRIDRNVFLSVKTASLHGILEILSSESAQPEAPYVFSERYHAAKNKDAYSEWVSEYVSRYEEMKSWSCGHSSGASDDTISKLLTEKLHSISSGEGEETAENVMRLTCALVGTGLTGDMVHRPTVYGLSLFAQNDFVKEFAAKHPDPGVIEVASALIAAGKLNRLEDLDDIFTGDVPIAISSGIL